MPTSPANAAASAPMPNHNSTKPDVKTSATMSIAPRMLHKTQNQSLIFVLLLLTFHEVLHHKPDICRALGKPAHEVRIPVFSVRNIDAHVEAVSRELSLQVAPDAEEHLKLKLLFADAFALCEARRGVDHCWIVRGDAVVHAACKRQLHHLDVVFVNVLLVGKRGFGWVEISAFTDANAGREFCEFLCVGIGSAQVRLQHDA